MALAPPCSEERVRPGLRLVQHLDPLKSAIELNSIGSMGERPSRPRGSWLVPSYIRLVPQHSSQRPEHFALQNTNMGNACQELSNDNRSGVVKSITSTAG